MLYIGLMLEDTRISRYHALNSHERMFLITIEQLLIKEVLESLRTAQDFEKTFHVPPCHGLLLHGLPGTGKTFLAKAIATESGFYFLTVSISQLIHGAIGESEKALAKAFREARKNAPSVLFIDEMESIFMGAEHSGDVSQKVNYIVEA